MGFTGKCRRLPSGDESHGVCLAQNRSHERGNALIQVIVILFVLVLGVYFLSDRLITRKNVVLQTSSILRVRFALQSTLDYVYFAIQRRYCLDDNLLQDPACELNRAKGGVFASSTSQLMNGNARSIERILLSESQAANMDEMLQMSCVDLKLEPPFVPQPAPDRTGPLGPSNCWGDWYKRTNGGAPPPYRGSALAAPASIDIRVPVRNISTAHPLYPVVEPLTRALKQDTELRKRFTKNDLDLQLHVQIERQAAYKVPLSGNEVYFTVRIAFEDQNGKLLVANRIPLRTSSFGTMFPRELSTFSLLVPGGLSLDGNLHGVGDIVFPSFHNWTGGAGITFKSPVFVNGNIHLPPTPAAGRYSGGSQIYSPVTFADRVILGNGWVMDGGTPYVPETAGGKTDALWADNRLFGGFKAGVAVDAAWDKGLLQYGSMTITGGAIDDSLMHACLARNNAKSNSNYAKNAELYAGLATPATGTHFEYVLGDVEFSKSSESYPAIEFNPQNAPLGSVDNLGWRSATRAPASIHNGAVVQVAAQLGNNVKATARLALGNSFTLTPEPGSDALLQQLHQDWLDWKNATPAKPQDEIDAKKAAYDRLKDARQNPGTITITALPMVYGVATADKPQKHLVKITIDVTRPDTFLDDTATNILAPKLEITGYDSRYSANGIINPANDPALADSVKQRTVRYLKFANDGTQLTAQTDFYKSLTDTDTFADPYNPHSPPYDDKDYVDFDNKCETAANRASGQSFGASGWNIDLASSPVAVRKSWNFANEDTSGSQVGETNCPVPAAGDPNPSPDTSIPRYAMCEKIFWEGNSLLNNVVVQSEEPLTILGRESFAPYSIVKDCVVKAGAELVAGFLVCDYLTIEARTKPLYMVGTFIVKNLDIQGSNTLKTGITWMSVYHPDAVSLLRKAKILRPTQHPAQDCATGLTSLPIWDLTGMSTQHKQDFSSCNVSSLRLTTQPFTWTAMDPDCGQPPGASNTVCKKHPVNYLVMEQGRGGGP